MAIFEFAAVNDGHTEDGDRSEDEIDRPELTTLDDERLQNGGPKGKRGDSNHADGDVGDLHR